MQRIERYGVIALVFLLVTILAVAVWGQRKNQSLLSFLKRDKTQEVAKVDTATPGAPALPTGLGLSTPTHEVNAATPQPVDVGGTIDPTTQLAPLAGPGSSAVSFDHGTTPNAGFVGTDVNGGNLGGSGLALPNPGVLSDAALPPLAAGARTYKVKSGDTLGGIAQRELGSTKRWKEIEALNGVKADRLSVGMVLKLPAGASSAGPQTLVKADAPPRALPASDIIVGGNARTYSVRSGDSLTKIAAAQLGDANRYGEILLLNPGLNPARLSVGQSLRLPPGSHEAKARNTESKPKPRPSQETSEVARVDSSPKKAKVQ